MATVIQQTPRPSFGAALGGGLGQGIGTMLLQQLKKQEQQEKMKKFSAFVSSVQGAPSREQAFNILSGALSSGIAEDPQDVNAMFHLIDMTHPLKDQTPHAVTMYDQKGNPQTRYLPAGSVGQTNDPNFMSQNFPGLSMENPGPKKPYVVPEGTPYQVDPSGFDVDVTKQPEYAGSFTEKNAPQGAVPEDAYKLGLDFARGKRQQQTEERQAQATELRAGAEQRRAASSERQAQNQKEDNLRQDLSHAEGALKTYYGKTLDSGLFGGFDDENKRSAYVKALEKSKDYIRKGDDYATAVSKAIKDVGVIRPDVPAAPNPKPKTDDKKGFSFKNFWGNLTGSNSSTGDKGLSADQKQMKQAIEKAGQKYEPDKYDYKIVGNQILRKAKGK